MGDIMVSIIIPVYNSEKTIIDTLNGILKQSAIGNVIEIIIVNDGSTDKTMDLITSISKKNQTLIKVISQKNQGVSEARNRGVKESKGNWIAFCDSDDIWAKEKLQNQIYLIKKYNLLFLGTGLVRYNPKVGTFYKDNIYSINIRQLLLKTWPQTSTVILSKDIFNKAGGFPVDQQYAEDGDLWINVLKFTKIFYLKEELVLYGGGKEMFGISGLSSNIKQMHLGVLKNIKDAYRLSLITKIDCWLFLMLENIKYLRRLIICLLKRWFR